MGGAPDWFCGCQGSAVDHTFIQTTHQGEGLQQGAGQSCICRELHTKQILPHFPGAVHVPSPECKSTRGQHSYHSFSTAIPIHTLTPSSRKVLCRLTAVCLHGQHTHWFGYRELVCGWLGRIHRIALFYPFRFARSAVSLPQYKSEALVRATCCSLRSQLCAKSQPSGCV